MEGLGLASQSIPDLIGSYQKSKQMGQAADYIGLEGERRDAFLALPEEIQAKVLPGLISEANKRRSEGERIPLESQKWLDKFYPDFASQVDKRTQFADLSQKYFNEGLGKTESYKKAIEEMQGGKSFEGLPELGQEKSGSKMFPNAKKFTAKGALEDLARPFTHFEEQPIAKLGKESPGAIPGSLALGTVAPIEEIAQYLNPITAAEKLLRKTGLLPPREEPKLLSEILRDELQSGLSEEGKKTAGRLETLGSLIPIESAVAGLAKIGKASGFFKNVDSIAAAKGISAEEAAQTILKQAEKEGIDLAKAAAGDKQEAGKLFNLSNRVSREAPETATLKRVERAEPEKKIFPTKERMATRETQLKEFPKYEAEIAQDAAERAARAESRIPKTEVGKASQRLRAEEAMRNLPKAEEGFRKAIARVRALEDEAATLSGAAKERANALIELSKNELRDAEFALKQSRENLTGQSVRTGLAEMREAAQKKMLDIASKLEKGEEVILSKADYNPEMIHKAKEISKKRSLPAVKQDDFYTQVHKEYGDQYKKQLQRIEQELKDLPKTMVSAEQYNALKKERDILKKLADQTDAEQKIHRHKLGLREAQERHKAAERLKELKKSEGHPKVEQVAKAKIEEAIRNPLGKEAEDLAKEAGVPKEEIGKAKSEFKKAWEEVKEKTQEPKKAKEAKGKKAPPAGKNLAKELKRFSRNIQKQRFYFAFMKTPVGREILFALATSVANDVLGLKLNPYVTAIAGARSKMYPVRAAVAQVYTWLKPKKRILQHQYKKHIEEGTPESRQKVADFQRKHPKWAKEARGF